MNPRIPWSFRYRARLHRVVDGDTFDLMLSHGVGDYRLLRVRLRGVDTGPARSPEGKAATAWVTQWLTDHADPDGVLIVQTYKDTTEAHGRFLADITGADGASLAADLVASGHGLPWDGKGAHPKAPASPVQGV